MHDIWDFWHGCVKTSEDHDDYYMYFPTVGTALTVGKFLS